MEKIDWQKILSLLFKLSFWAALAVVPLGMSFFFPVYSPFSVVKTFWMQVLGAVSLILFIVINHPWQQSFFEINWRRLLRAIAPIWIFFFAWAILSLFSSNILQSWFGSYERHLGLLSYFWLCVWYSLVVFHFSGLSVKIKTEVATGWQQALKILSVVASIVGGLIGVYAFLQFVGIDFTVWQEAQLNSRAISTLGQPNFLGSFLLLTIPLTVYSFFEYSSFRVRAFVALLGAWQLVGLLVSGSRAAWLAFIVVLGLAAVWFAWRRFGRWSLLIAGGVIMIAPTLFYLAAPTRLTSLVDFENGSTALRRLFYQSAIGAISEKPWLGVGLENGGEAMVSYYRLEWGIFMNVDGYTDKAHNSLLDVIIQTGLIGFIFYVALYFYFSRQCWLLWKKPGGKNFALAAASSLLAYSISILFGLTDIASVFYFWLIAAFVVAGNISLGQQEDGYVGIKLTLLGRLSVLTAGVGLAILCLAQVYLSLNTLQADYYFLQLQYLRPEKNYYNMGQMYLYLEESALNPVNRAHYQRALSSFAVSDYDALPDLSSERLVYQIISSINNDLPGADYDNEIARARLSCFLEGEQESASAYDQIIARSPYRPFGYRERAACRVRANNLSGALADYDAALSLLPSISDERLNRDHQGYVRYYTYTLHNAKARIFDLHQDDISALTSYRLAYSNFPEDVSTLRYIAGRLERLGRNNEADKILKHALSREPKSADWPLALAGFYQRAGDKEMALEYARQASALSPYVDLELFSN
ncbi:MAG: O-antigen ligase family protein [bacterium]|nr:O-antigen ligase family protein [bacterium]